MYIYNQAVTYLK